VGDLETLPILPMLPSRGAAQQASYPGEFPGGRRAIKMADIGEPVRRITVVPRRRLPAPPAEPPRRNPDKEPAPRRKKREKLPA